MNIRSSIEKRPLLQCFRALRAAWHIEILRSVARSSGPVALDQEALPRAALKWPPLILCMGLDLYVNPGRPVSDPVVAGDRIAENIVKLLETNAGRPL